MEYIAQLDISSGRDPEGCGFDPHHSPRVEGMGSNPI